jgi:hypothetical protein
MLAWCCCNVKVARSTAYGWKKEDQEFDAAWVDAVETALDALETQLYDSAMNGNSQDAQFILRYRRYNNDGGRPQQPNFFSNITLQDRLKRLERLGLPLPVIETDYHDVELLKDQNASSEVLGMRFCVLPNGNIDVTTQGITVSAGSQHRHCAYLHVPRSVIMRCRS